VRGWRSPFATPAFAQLSKAEAQMAATVDAEYERSVALLEKLVNQNSGSMNFDGVRKVGDMMRAELEPLGFRLEWLDMAAAGRAGHLVATKQGKKGTKRLLLVAHLDTVFEPDSPFQKFVRKKGEPCRRPGCWRRQGRDDGDRRSALRAMQAAGTLKDANIEIHMTGDEEDAGDPIEITRAPLIAAGKRADVALDFEGLVPTAAGHGNDRAAFVEQLAAGNQRQDRTQLVDLQRNPATARLRAGAHRPPLPHRTARTQFDLQRRPDCRGARGRRLMQAASARPQRARPISSRVSRWPEAISAHCPKNRPHG
jgi:hypothetical protein